MLVVMIISYLKGRQGYVVTGLILLVTLYALLPQFGNFHTSWTVLAHTRLHWALAALAAAGLTYVLAATTYWLLSFKKLIYKPTVIVQLAAMFLNRLLPAGVGALGTNYLYLKKQKHDNSQAATIVAVNNLLGFTGHALLTGLTVGLFSRGIKLSDRYQFPVLDETAIGLTLLSLILIGCLLAAFRWPQSIRFLKGVKKQLASYRRRKLRLSLALGSSLALTLSNVLAFYLCVLASGATVSPAAAFLVFTLGVGLGTVVPTPGGLGAFEAGLVAGLMAYGINSGTALAIALLYRFITYWLAIILGAVAFVYVERRHYI